MTVFGISKEGVENLNQLASDLSKLNNDIEQAGVKLKTTVNSYGDSLGIYEDQINDLVDSVNATQKAGSESIELLTNSIKNLAQRVEELVAAGLGS